MKSNVTVEELNAATLLLSGVPVTQLAEVHIAGSVVTVITADEDGNLKAHRVPIGEAPLPDIATDETPSEEEAQLEIDPGDET